MGCYGVDPGGSGVDEGLACGGVDDGAHDAWDQVEVEDGVVFAEGEGGGFIAGDGGCYAMGLAGVTWGIFVVIVVTGSSLGKSSC